MFIENSLNTTHRRGVIEVICGSMFSGKTEELIRRLNRSRIARLRVQIFKPAVDVRYDEDDVVSHDQNAIEAVAVENASQIILYASDADVIGIDEAQFFGDELGVVCNQLADMGVRVIVAGLDMDYQGNPFGPIPHLLAVADFVTKVHAICMECGDLAHFSYRKVHNDKLVFLGETESYEPLCRRCYNQKQKDEK